ncbi:MAG: DUF202 domain-containing protein [Kineosporiaceae bacterium]
MSGATGRPGLQPERTAMAWHRTGVAATAVGGVCLLGAAHAGRWWLLGAACLAAGGAAVLSVLIRDAVSAEEGARTERRWSLLTATAGVVLALAVVGALLCASP